MKSAHVVAIILTLTLASNCAYSQLWKQYADCAKALNNQKNMDIAIEFYTKAKAELKKDSEETNTYAGICDTLANLYIRIGKYEMAEPLYIEAKQIREKLFSKTSAEYAACCIRLGSLYSRKGAYGKAEPLLLEIKQIREELFGKESSDYAEIRCELGELYTNMRQYLKAEPLLLEAKQIREKAKGKESVDYASSCNCLGRLYRLMGYYEKAEPLLLQAKQIRENKLGKESSEYAQSCHRLGILYEEMGQYERAESLFLEAKQIREKVLGKTSGDYVESCNRLGFLYFKKREYQKAEPLLVEAKQMREQIYGKENLIYAPTCNHLGDLYIDMGEYKKAKSVLLEAKQIYEKAINKENPDYAENCNSLGNLYTITGEYQKAEPLFLEAKLIREKVLGKEHPDYAKTCIDLANLCWNTKRPEKAKDFYTEAYTSQQIQIKNIFRFTSEPEKQDYLRKAVDFESYFLSFDLTGNAHSNHGFSYNFSLSHRNLILSSSKQLRQAIYNSTDASLKSKYNTWMEVREKLAFWYSKPISERPDYKDLEAKANTLEKELTRLSSTFKNEQAAKEITWQDIQQSLQSNEAAIEFVKFNLFNGKRWTDSTYYAALLLRKDQAEPELIPLFESRQLDKVLRQSNSARSKYALYPAINNLYSSKEGVNTAYGLIWKPVDQYLSGIKKIYFVPAGLLFRISFAALPVNDHQLLSDKYELVQLNTTAAVVNQAADMIDSAHNMYLYGAIKYDTDSATLKQAVIAYRSSDSEENYLLPDDATIRDSSLEYLAGSQKEITEIDSMGKQKKYAIVVISGDSATEESVKALNGTASPTILHIATHGFFFPDPKERKDSVHSSMGSQNPFRQSDNPLMRSGLFFAGAINAWKGKPIEGVEDGILTSYEVSNLYLPNTKLAVLSACQTALGDIQGNEGVYGLQRAFKMAGVQNLVMSLWKVPDETTAEFMQAFYKNIFNQQFIEDAFYNAQTVMKNKYRDNPFKWAAWILVR